MKYILMILAILCIGCANTNKYYPTYNDYFEERLELENAAKHLKRAYAKFDSSYSSIRNKCEAGYIGADTCEYLYSNLEDWYSRITAYHSKLEKVAEELREKIDAEYRRYEREFAMATDPMYNIAMHEYINTGDASLLNAIVNRAYYSTNTRSTAFICNDGTLSYAKHRQGACSWHGGIAE